MCMCVCVCMCGGRGEGGGGKGARGESESIPLTAANMKKGEVQMNYHYSFQWRTLSRTTDLLVTTHRHIKQLLQ